MRDPRMIVRRALVSEKGTQLGETSNQFIFEVDSSANKLEIKQAVETIFNVKVKSVRTMNRAGKRKRLGAFTGRRSHWKKAVVTLREGHTIPLFEQV